MKVLTVNLLFAFCLSFASTVKAQSSMWKELGNVAYKKEYNELLGFKVDVPVFGPEIWKLEGKEITLRGFIVPTEGFKSHSEFVFSAFPYSMCFFCGGAGPETVIEVEAAEPVKFTTDAIWLQGILHLNEKDMNRLMYKMTEVVRIDDPSG